MIKAGYACINTTLGDDGRFFTSQISRLNQMSVENRVNIVKHKTLKNLKNTKNNIVWCIKNNIGIYRLSSEIVVKATYIQEWWKWYNDIDVMKLCSEISTLIRTSGIRCSFHPEFTSFTNFNNPEVFNTTTMDILTYHNILAEMLSVDTILVHIGGVHGDKDKAINQFIKNFNRLPQSLKNKIHIENDKTYGLEDILLICEKVCAPCVWDLHHEKHYRHKHQTSNLYDINKDRELFERVKLTWNGKLPKLHLSSGKKDTFDYSHADYVTQEDYNCFLDLTYGEAYCIIECKKKEKALYQLGLL